MAKSNESFDQIFKEKLQGHQEKPSALAWERLENQLPKSKKPGAGFWWAIAASLSGLMLVAYLNWPSDVANSDQNLVATLEETPEANNISGVQASENEASSSENNPEESRVAGTNPPVETKEVQTQSKPKQGAVNPKQTPKESKNQPLLADASEQPEIQKEIIPIPEKKIAEPELSIPNLKAPDLTKTVAEAQTKTSDEPLYRVSIYSNGIKKAEPVEKNLITELGKTVGQVEGLLGKVDEGFAEIQDKKDNLFASLTSRKERADEKP